MFIFMSMFTNRRIWVGVGNGWGSPLLPFSSSRPSHDWRMWSLAIRVRNLRLLAVLGMLTYIYGDLRISQTVLTWAIQCGSWRILQPWRLPSSLLALPPPFIPATPPTPLSSSCLLALSHARPPRPNASFLHTPHCRFVFLESYPVAINLFLEML